MLREDLRVGGFESGGGAQGETGKRCSCVKRLSTHGFLIFKCEKLQSSFAFVFFSFLALIYKKTLIPSSSIKENRASQTLYDGVVYGQINFLFISTSFTKVFFFFNKFSQQPSGLFIPTTRRSRCRGINLISFLA